jgi:hypothetical protein
MRRVARCVNLGVYRPPLAMCLGSALVCHKSWVSESKDNEGKRFEAYLGYVAVLAPTAQSFAQPPSPPLRYEKVVSK